MPTCHALPSSTMRALRNQVIEHEAARVQHKARIERAHRYLHARRLGHHGLSVVDRVQTLHRDLLHRDIRIFVHGSYPSSVPVIQTIFHIVRVHAVRRHQSGAHRVLRLVLSPPNRHDLAVEAEGPLDQRRKADAHHIGKENEDQIDGLQTVDRTIVDETDQAQKGEQEKDCVTQEHHFSDLQRLLRNHGTNSRD